MGLAIGVDLGGTKISAVLMDERGNVLQKFVRLTEANKSKKIVIANLVEAINAVRNGSVKLLGIGVPGFCNKNGKIIHMPNIPCLVGVNLRKEIWSKTGLIVSLANDADCFALAEAKLGAGKRLDNVIGVIIGTGVGCGLILNGKIYQGKSGGAGELGHSKLLVNTDGSFATVESLIAGPSFMRRYNALSGKSMNTISEIDKKDLNFKKVYSEFVNNTSVFFANIINTFNPDCIVVGGGVSNLDFFKDVEKRAKSIALPKLAKDCAIKKNKLGADAGVLGAGMLAMQ